ncbi:SCO6745 family protein [Actinomadura kijaniata]|uniref:SCO6745 family protein n=1 Tax=Actinomadura kijaniata TaxID=46161 RepID=UPI003F1BB689
MSLPPSRVRNLWHLTEPVHAVLYYAPEVVAEAAALGYATDTRWPSYFAWRAAPLGAAGTNAVAAAFYSFSPAMVAEHVPAAWRIADPGAVLAARSRAIDATYRTLLGDALASPEVKEAAELARRAAESAGTAGRPLAAANADLPWPDEPHLVLWQAATILREHRGDGHVASLLTEGLDPVEALVSFAAFGAARRQVFDSRGWTPGQWEEAGERLRSRGLLAADGTLTEEGRALRQRIEERTDALAAGPWETLGEAGADRFTEAIAPVWAAAVGSGLLPAENTLGIGKIA